MDVDFETRPKQPIPINVRAVSGGDAFKHEDKLYMKLEIPKELKTKEFPYNAIRLGTGELVVFNPSEAVEIRHDAKIILIRDDEE